MVPTYPTRTRRVTYKPTTTRLCCSGSIGRLLEVKRGPDGVLVLGREGSVGAEQLIWRIHFRYEWGPKISPCKRTTNRTLPHLPRNPPFGSNFF